MCMHVWMKIENKNRRRGPYSQKIRTLTWCYATDSSVKKMFVVGPKYCTSPPPSPTHTAAQIILTQPYTLIWEWRNIHFTIPDLIASIQNNRQKNNLFHIRSYSFNTNFLRMSGLASTAADCCVQSFISHLTLVFDSPTMNGIAATCNTPQLHHTGDDSNNVVSMVHK